MAFATASITLTDGDDGSLFGDGATLSGLLAGAKAYRAIYNGSTTWANLVSNTSAPALEQNTSSERTRFPDASRSPQRSTPSSLSSSST